MAHLPGQGEDENYYDMIMISSPPMEFADFLPSSENGAKPHHRQNILSKRYSGQQDYAEFLEQNPSYVARQEKFQDSHHAGFVEDHIHHHEDLHFDSEMFANPNPHPNSNSNQIQNPNQNQNNIKVETPDLLSPTTIGPGYRSRNSDFASSQSIYSDTGSNAQSIFHDAASHFSGAAEPPTAVFFDQTASNLDTFNQEIALGESISSTNLAEMNLGNHAVFAENAYARSAYSNGQRYSSQDFQQNVPAVNLNEEPSFQSDTWRYNCGSPITGDAFPALQNMYDGYSNRLTENNLSSYNVKMENSDAKVTISIHQAPEYVAARTPSLFSNSSHNSLSGNKPNYSGNQLQPPGQPQRSRTPSITNVPPSPIQSWQHSASPSLNLPSPGASVYSDIEDDTFLRPDDYQNMRRGRQSVHLQKVRSRSHSRSNSRSGSVSARSTSDFYDSGSEVDPNDPQDDADEARAAREKMLELASSATISKRTQIHPSSYACHLCEKKFTRPYNLKSHLRTHTDERPFICNICGKAFARQHDRKRHEELHSGEKKYQCRGILRDGTPFGCSRKFARADALRRHFQTESGKECIKLLVEEDAREQNENNGILSSGIQLPDGEFMNPNAPEIPVLSVSPPQ